MAAVARCRSVPTVLGRSFWERWPVKTVVAIYRKFGVIALQIRNNDLLMDIRDGQRELNGTMRELVEAARGEHEG